MKIYQSLVLIGLIKYLETSIVGVTYMDNFDFENRYRNVNECNPFYWHPLHLPEECIEMYDKLLRSNIGSVVPIQVFKGSNYFDILDKQFEKGSPYSRYVNILLNTDLQMYINSKRHLSPLERMMEMIRGDAMRIPTAPKIGIAPQYGPIALYRQPISSKSEKAIKEIAGAYRNAMTQP